MINWDSIDTVLLDMDGTLLDLAFDNYFWQQFVPREYGQKNGLDEAASQSQLNALFNTERGTLNWYCLDYWSQQLNLDLPALKHSLRHLITLRPFTIDFLRQLQQDNYDMVLVTNAHRKTLDIKMAEIDLRPWFDRIVVSHELGHPKEKPEFWHALQALHPFNPERTLLIDDTEKVLESAQAYGIAHLLSLLQPDSQQQKRLDLKFPSIHHFDEIMPAGTP